MSNFPIFVDLSTLPSGFHSGVNANGTDIRVTKHDGITELPREVVFYDAATDTGELHFKGDITDTHDSDFYIYYNNPSAAEPAVTATYGRNNVWTGAKAIIHGTQNVLDSSGNGFNGTLKEVTQGAGFLNFPGEVAEVSSLTDNTTIPFGKATTYQKLAIKFTANADAVARLDILIRRAANNGTPAGTVTVALQDDSSGSPSGTNLFSATISATNLTTSTLNVDKIISSLAANLTNGTVYWIVISTNTQSDTNYYNFAFDSGASGVTKYWDGSAWQTQAGYLRCAIYKSGYVDLGAQTQNLYNNFAISWTMRTSNSLFQALIVNALVSVSGQIEFGKTLNKIRIESITNGVYQKETVNTGITISDGVKHRYTIVSNGIDVRTYVDGILTSTDSVWSDAVTQQFRYLGAIQARLPSEYGRAFEGEMKEIWFRPAQAVGVPLTEFNNLASPSTFYTVGTAVCLTTGGRLKYWDGDSWEVKTLKYWDGSGWTTKTLKYWDGDSWQS